MYLLNHINHIPLYGLSANPILMSHPQPVNCKIYDAQAAQWQKAAGAPGPYGHHGAP